MGNPTAEQQAAIEARGARVLVMAGPGSGKTRTLCARARHIAGEKDLGTVGIVTFTVAAAEEIKARLGKTLASQFCHVGTLHSLAYRSQHHLTLADEDRAQEARQRVQEQYSNMGPTQQDIARASRDPRTGVEREYCRAMNRELAKDGMTSIDECLRLYSEGLESGEFRPIPTLLVDEVQDASTVDWKAYEASPELFCVGDDQQSIYGFRGARPELFRTRARKTAPIELLRNFRSAPNLIEASDRLVGRHSTPHLTEPGELRIEAPEPGEAWDAIATLGEREGTTAVLCRTNRQVTDAKAALESRGTTIATAKQTNRKLLVALIHAHLRPTLHSADFLARAKRNDTATIGATQPEEVFGRLGYGDRIERIDIVGKAPKPLKGILGQAPGADLLQILEEYEEPADRGTVVQTVHASKGLEYDHVAIPEISQALYPAEPEETRILYVAMTRARKSLYCFGCHDNPATHYLKTLP